MGWLAQGDSQAPVPPASVPRGESNGPSGDAASRAPVFTQETDTVLLFDDGLDGAVALDLDAGTSHEVPLPGQRPGDRPFRLWPYGSSVLVGAGEVWKVTPGPQMSSERLAEATTFLPHADNTLVWLVDTPSGGTGIGGGTWRLVDGSGTPEAVVEPPVTQGWNPIRGVPGGLAVRAEDGTVARYDLESGEVVDYLDGSSAALLDVTHDRVVWCVPLTEDGGQLQGGCDRVHVEGPPRAATLGSGETFLGDGVWLQPGGAHLAADVATRYPDGASDRRLRIYDLETGEVVADEQLPLGGTHGAWDAAGEQFFAWLRFPGQGGPRVLNRWEDGHGIEQVDMQGLLDDVHGFVTLRRDAVGAPADW